MLIRLCQDVAKFEQTPDGLSKGQVLKQVRQSFLPAYALTLSNTCISAGLQVSCTRGERDRRLLKRPNCHV